MAALQPSDLYNPWLESVTKVNPVPRPLPEERWDGTYDSHARWWSDTQLVLHEHDLTRMAEATRITYGLLDPAHPDDDHHEDHETYALGEVYGTAINIQGGWIQATHERAQALNAQRLQYIKRDKSRWCAAVTARLHHDVQELILDPAQPELRNDPDLLYQAINQRAIGGGARQVGPRIQREALTYSWPSKGPNGATRTWVQQVDIVIAKYRSIMARLTALNHDDYLLPEASMVATICAKAPSQFDTSAIAVFEASTNLATLQQEMQQVARRMDERSLTGLQAFVTVDAVKEQNDKVDSLQSELATLRAKLASMSSRPKGVKLSVQRRMDRDAGAPFDGAQYCTHHGWGKHGVDRCFVLHPELAPAGWRPRGGSGQQ